MSANTTADCCASLCSGVVLCGKPFAVTVACLVAACIASTDMDLCTDGWNWNQFRKLEAAMPFAKRPHVTFALPCSPWRHGPHRPTSHATKTAHQSLPAHAFGGHACGRVRLDVWGCGVGGGWGSVSQANAINVKESTKPRQSVCAYGSVPPFCSLTLQYIAAYFGHVAGGLHPASSIMKQVSSRHWVQIESPVPPQGPLLTPLSLAPPRIAA